MKTKLLIIFSAASLAACSSPEDKFVDSCVQIAGHAEGSEEICACGYSKLVEKYGEEKMVYLIENPTHVSQIPYGYIDAAMTATAQCMGMK